MTQCHKRGDDMPKETFYHLKTEKREKVEKAIENEFGRTTLEKASISKIIEEAQIPRGSFYQYFEDKEDAIKYIMKKYILLEKETMKRILLQTRGNIFEATLKNFDYMALELEGNPKITLYKNIMQELKKNNINLLNSIEEEKSIEEIHGLIDTSILNIKEENELKDMIKIISIVTRTANINVCSGNISIQEARDELEKQIDILKRGMAK